MIRLFSASVLSFLLIAANFVPVQAQELLPLPRFVSLHAQSAKLRTGPGKRYPVEWIYVRRDLPMEIIAEHENWRKVRDLQGGEGWVHRNLLTGRRHVIIIEDNLPLLGKPKDRTRIRARLASGVIARVQSCIGENGWCEVSVNRMKGWVPQHALWGVYVDETIK